MHLCSLHSNNTSQLRRCDAGGILVGRWTAVYFFVNATLSISTLVIYVLAYKRAARLG